MAQSQNWREQSLLLWAQHLEVRDKHLERVPTYSQRPVAQTPPPPPSLSEYPVKNQQATFILHVCGNPLLSLNIQMPFSIHQMLLSLLHQL